MEIVRTTKENSHCAIPTEWLTDNRLSLSTKGMLAELAAKSQKEEYTIDDLLELFRASDVFKAIKELKKCNYITIIGKGEGSCPR